MRSLMRCLGVAVVVVGCGAKEATTGTSQSIQYTFTISATGPSGQGIGADVCVGLGNMPNTPCVSSVTVGVGASSSITVSSNPGTTYTVYTTGPSICSVTSGAAGTFGSATMLTAVVTCT